MNYRLRELHQLLAEVLALQHTDERFRRILETNGDGLAILDLAGGDALGKLLQRYRPALHVVGDDETLDLDAVADHGDEVLDAVAVDRIVVRDHAAERETGERVGPRQHGIQDLAADIFEIHIDALRRGGGEIRMEALGPVVDAGVEAEFLDHVVTFLFAPSYAESSGALHSGQLPHDATDCARGRSDDDGFAGLRLANVEQSHPGCDTRHADDAEIGRDRHQLGIDLAEVPAVGNRILLPATARADRVAGRELR